MIHARCKCGKKKFWGSWAPSKCDPCEECGTVLGVNPDDHGPAEAHLWSEPEWKIDSKTGERWQERRCLRCFQKERL